MKEELKQATLSFTSSNDIQVKNVSYSSFVTRNALVYTINGHQCSLYRQDVASVLSFSV